MGADRIQNGPLNSAGTNPYDQQALIQDTQNNTLEVSGNTHQRAILQSAVQVLGAQTALTAITTAQTLISKVFNPGALNVQNRTISVTGYFIYTTPGTTTPTITIALTLGGVTLCSITTAALSATASTNMPVNFYFEVTTATLGASATLESHGTVNANISANTPAAAITAYNDTNVAVSSAVNLITSATLTVTIAASSAVTSAQLRMSTIEIVG